MAGAALFGSVACVVLGAVVAFSSFDRQVDQFQRGPLPGQTVLSFDRPGGYTVYLETDTGPGIGVHWGTDAAEEAVTLPPYSMSLVGVNGGEQIPLQPYSSDLSYTSGGHAGQAMRTFHIDTPGSYLLDVVGPRPPVAANVAVGRGIGQSMRVLALALPAALILFGGAVGLIAVVAVRRHRASHPLPTPTPWAGTGEPGAVPAGWFPDSGRTHQLRYWDGQTWTEHVADPPPPAESQGRKTSLISKSPARHRGIVATLAAALLLLVIVVVVQQVAVSGAGGDNDTTERTAQPTGTHKVDAVQQGAVLLQDDFSDSTSGLESAAYEEGETGYVDGAYRILVRQAGRQLGADTGGDAPVQAVRVEVETTQLSGTSGDLVGVSCFTDVDSDVGYIVGITPADQGYAIAAFEGDNYRLLEATRETATAVRPIPQENQLRVDCIARPDGSTALTLTANGQELVRAEDETGGHEFDAVGLFVDTTAGGAEALFDDLVVTELLPV